MTSPNETMRIVIVGGGLAGCSVALRLLRGARTPLAVHLIDPQEFPGRGIAYATTERGHTLNAPALRHIVHADDPDHFPRWLAERRAQHRWPEAGEGAAGDAYPPRWLLGSYIQDELRAAIAAAEPGVGFRHHRAVATDVVRTGDRLSIRAGADTLAADHVVLATGIFAAEGRFAVDPALRDDRAYIADPWRDRALDAVPADGHVVILGSHLTMMDCVVSLEARGFRGHYTILSRHGLVPGLSYVGPAWEDFLASAPLPQTARALLRRLREEQERARTAGMGWQSVMAAVRPHIRAMWEGASQVERKRFDRHLRPRSLGHAAPPIAFETFAAVRHAGRVVVRACRIGAIDRDGARISVAWRPRGGDRFETGTFDALIDCTGPDYDWRRIGDPLVGNLLRRGLVRPHPLGAGIDGEPDGRVVGSDGVAADDLSACGHPFHGGVFYESSASSALREQSIALTERLLARHHRDSQALLERQGEIA